jgi:hypothetical protein
VSSRAPFSEPKAFSFSRPANGFVMTGSRNLEMVERPPKYEHQQLTHLACFTSTIQASWQGFCFF